VGLQSEPHKPVDGGDGPMAHTEVLDYAFWGPCRPLWGPQQRSMMAPEGGVRRTHGLDLSKYMTPGPSISMAIFRSNGASPI